MNGKRDGEVGEVPLKGFERNIYSQFGEDGVLEEIFHRIGKSPRPAAIEFGAWDGKHLSNTYNLLRQGQFDGLLIEPNPRKFRELKDNFKHLPKVSLDQGFVEVQGARSLDSIVASKVPSMLEHLDVLSIDVDGLDYHLWRATEKLSPRVVVIEYNPTIHNDVDWVQECRPVCQGASAKALVRLGRDKGYELAHVTLTNLIFVRGDLFPALGIKDNSLSVLRQHQELVTYFFYGYDGTVFTAGHSEMFWHRIVFRSKDFQLLPLWLRRFPDHYRRWHKWAFDLLKWFRSLY